MSMRILLASRSPRRRELLEQIGVAYELVDVEVDETPRDNESPAAQVERLARAKAEAGRAARVDGPPVLGADTLVAVDGVALGKPRDRDEALDMLARLSGRSHEVWSGIAMAGDDHVRSETVRTRVTMRDIEAAERVAYWDTGEPEGKAGAYAIQGRAAVFVESISGSWSNVVGLPLFETARLLRHFGIDPLDADEV
ncbi:MAG: Maf family protein [Halofilum sp. (in: g-proteobacteria)]|nr:Maf family protein [Halofilum sp. (in: g-proteobacteria)]